MSTSALTSRASSVTDIPRRRYQTRGAATELFYSHAPEVVIAGPAGTGKSRTCFEKIHLLCCLVPGLRVLGLRKTFASFKASGLVTFDEKVQPELDGAKFWGPTKKRPAQYVYPNKSVFVVGGLDDASKVLSTEYDIIYIQQAEEIEEDEWDKCSTRCRNYKIPWQQLIADVNPDAPQHWLKLKADAGAVQWLDSRHEDNPRYFTDDGQLTAEGAAYLARLDALTGVRYARYRLGLWVAAEGMIYESSWDRKQNLAYQFPIPREWPRYLSIDFGYTNPFVCQWWAQDPDGRLYRYREIYKTQTLVEDHAALIKKLSRWGEPEGEPYPYAIICDHDAEGRATLEKHLGMTTTPAFKKITAGIQEASARMRLAGDGKPRLVLLRDSLVERDTELEKAKKPCCSEEEIEGYIWSDKAKEQPVDKNNHGMDALRYAVAHFDLNTSGLIQIGPRVVR